MNPPVRVGRYDIPDHLTAAGVRAIIGGFAGDAERVEAANGTGGVPARDGGTTMNSPVRVGRYDIPDHLTAVGVREIVGGFAGDAERAEGANGAGGNDNVTAWFVAGPEFRGRWRLTGRAAFLLGMGARR